MPFRERAARAGLQILLEANGVAFSREFNRNHDRPRPMFQREPGRSTIVPIQSLVDVGRLLVTVGRSAFARLNLARATARQTSPDRELGLSRICSLDSDSLGTQTRLPRRSSREARAKSGWVFGTISATGWLRRRDGRTINSDSDELLPCRAVLAAYSIRMYLDVTGAAIMPASVPIGVNQRWFPSSLMLRRVKFLSA